MEWSLGLGLEPWSGVLEWILKWNIFSYFALRGQELVRIHQFLVNAYFYEALSFYSLCCHVSLTYVNQNLNICFIINRQVYVFQTHIMHNVSYKPIKTFVVLCFC